MLKDTGWKSTAVGFVFGLIMLAVEANGVSTLTVKDVINAIQPMVLAFLINNKYFN